MEKENNPFNILSNESDAPKAKGGSSYQEENRDAAPKDRIEKMIAGSKVFLFMKGNPEFPQCGFSANTIAILNHLQIDYKTFDVLSDMNIREGIKAFSNWPTIPQLYINGEFMGGNDIITEMHQSGELQKAIK